MAKEKKILQVLDSLTKPDVARAEIESLMPGSSEHRSNLKTVLESKNIMAVGISEKISKRKKTGKLALTFYVEKKISLKKLKGNEVIPPTVPESMSGAGTAIPTDVIEIGELRPEENITRKHFQPGNSIGHFKKNDAGTFGAVVKDNKGKLYILSNCHVLAKSGTAKIGDKIVYPGVFDSGKSPADVKAILHKFIALQKGAGYPNVTDCAIAAPLDDQLLNMLSEIKGVGVPKGVIKAKRGMKVVKVGRTSGKTKSEITDVNFRGRFNYKGKLGKIGFRDQVWCSKKYTEPGDSGSLVLDQATGKAVALHFAGAQQGGSVHNPIQEVLKALGVKLITKKLPKKKQK